MFKKNRLIFFGILLAGLWGAGTVGLLGCGGASSSDSSTASSLSLSATVQLPSSTTSGALIVDGFKSATTDTPQAGMTAVFIDGDTDTELARCKTGSDGKCTVTPTTAIATGEHNIFVKVLDKKDEEIAGSILNSTVASDTTTVATTVDSTEDLAYQTWKGAAEKEVGAGFKFSDAIKKVVPSCTHDAFKEMVKSDTSKTGATDTSDVYMGALLEAHKSNIAQGISTGSKPPIDVACVMKGDATCQQSMINTLGSTVPTSALTFKDASTTVSTATAIDTATKMLDAVFNSMCNDPTTYKTIKDDKNYQADPGAAFKPFKMVKPSEFASLDTASMKKMMVNVREVGNGFKDWGDPMIARSTMETFFAGGFKKDLDDGEFKKRMGAVLGAGAPKDFNEAKDRGRAGYNMFGSTNWGSADGTDAYKRFGPLMANAGFRDDIIGGGKQAFDNYVEGQGGLTSFQKSFDGLGTGVSAATAFMNKYDQKDIGGTCAMTSDCRPPLSCSANKKCALGSVEVAFTGGFGTTCTKESDCATDKGFSCDTYRPTPSCIYAAGQASGGQFGVGGVAFTPPTSGVGAACTDSNQCGGKLCMNGGCFDAPIGGFSGGAPTGSTCTTATQCSSNNCAGGKCTMPGGNPIGGSCNVSAECASANCSNSVCALSGQTFTALADGKTCHYSAECQSANCSGGVCTALTTLKATGYVCVSSSACLSNNCVGGICQAAGNTKKPDGSFCTSSSECTSEKCQLSAQLISGFCGTKGYLGYSCTSNAGCYDPYTCKSGACAF